MGGQEEGCDRGQGPRLQGAVSLGGCLSPVAGKGGGYLTWWYPVQVTSFCDSGRNCMSWSQMGTRRSSQSFRTWWSGSMGDRLWGASVPLPIALRSSPKAHLVSDSWSVAQPPWTADSLPATHVLGSEHRLLRPLQVPHLQSILLPPCGNYMGVRWVLAHPTHPGAHSQFQELKKMRDERGNGSPFLNP